MYFDYTYVYFVLPAVILALIASAAVRSTYDKFSRQYSAARISGEQAAQRILYANGLSNVRVERVRGKLTDHYDPKENVVRLSESVFDSTSTAAIGVAAHEVGHALQYAEGYAPIKLRAAIIPITGLGSRLAIPLVILGLSLSYIAEIFISVAYAGLIIFSLVTLFQLLTLPVEFNASRRAMASIESQGMLTKEERKGARRVLSAAAMTYVAALAVSLGQLLRLLTIISRRRN